MRPHGRAQVDTSSPRGFAVCDRCGLWYNMVDLGFQREWAGSTQINTGALVCSICLDDLQTQLKTIILPPDPPPIINARVEPFSLDEGPNLINLIGVVGFGVAGNLTASHT
jgi:hypothetical protein